MASIRQEDAANNNFSLSPSSELRSSPERPKMLAKSKNLKNEKFETAFFVVAQVQCFVLTPLSLYRKRFFFFTRYFACVATVSFIVGRTSIHTSTQSKSIELTFQSNHGCKRGQTTKARQKERRKIVKENQWRLSFV